jgi:hypothetical protein
MSAIFAGILPYRTVMTVLAGTSATDCYTCGDDGEDEAILAGVVVVDSTGAIGTAAKIEHYKLSNTTAYTIVPASVALPSATENLVYECIPGHHMKLGDEIRVTGASGHHVFVSFWKVSPSAKGAQRG